MEVEVKGESWLQTELHSRSCRVSASRVAAVVVGERLSRWEGLKAALGKRCGDFGAEKEKSLAICIASDLGGLRECVALARDVFFAPLGINDSKN